jgi:hypothetical protein
VGTAGRIAVNIAVVASRHWRQTNQSLQREFFKQRTSDDSLPLRKKRQRKPKEYRAHHVAQITKA